MLSHDQWLLMGGVVGLYLYDSILMLCHNEIALEKKIGGYIVFSGGMLELGGRHLFLPNPCCPHRTIMRLSWPDNGLLGEQVQRMQKSRVELILSIIAPWTWGLFGLFFLALPSALWIGTSAVLLGWLVLTYLVIVAMLTQVCRYRRGLNLSARAVVGLALDALLCAPFAMNIVRKISLRQVPSSSLRAIAATMHSPAENAVLVDILHRRIHVSLNFMEPDSEASEELRAYLKHFEDGRS